MTKRKEWKPPRGGGRDGKLSVLQENFVREYLSCFVGSQAVIKAGYKVKDVNSATTIASRLLTKPYIKHAIDKAKEKNFTQVEVSAEYVTQKLLNIIEATEESNPNASLRGLELLGKHLGMYRDRQEISGPDGAAIQMEQKTKQAVNDFTQRLKRLEQLANGGKQSVSSDDTGEDVGGEASGVAQFPKRTGESGA